MSIYNTVHTTRSVLCGLCILNVYMYNHALINMMHIFGQLKRNIYVYIYMYSYVDRSPLSPPPNETIVPFML